MRTKLVLCSIIIFLSSCTLPFEDLSDKRSILNEVFGSGEIHQTEIIEAAPNHEESEDPFVYQPAVTEQSDIQETEEVNTSEEEQYKYSVQAGAPVWTENFLQPEKGCDWMGIGGQIFDTAGEPVIGLIIEVGGELNGNNLIRLGLTGGTTTLGTGGYKINLADEPISSQETLWIQIFNLAGQPQSKRIKFSTYSECDRNLMLLNFAEVTLSNKYWYLPFIHSNYAPEDN